MRDIAITLTSEDKQLYYNAVIREFENRASQLLITLDTEFTGYTYKVLFQLNDNLPFITPEIVPVDGVLTVILTNQMTFEAGNLKVELQAYNVDGYLAKSAIVVLKVQKAIEGTPLQIPPDYATWSYEATDQDDPTTFMLRNDESGTELKYLDLTPLPTAIPLAQGRLMWDETYKTLMFGLNGGIATHQIGQEFNVYARNVSGGTLTLGQVVAVSGSTGEIPSMVLADADGTDIQRHVFGLVGGVSIANNSNGYVLTEGILHNVDTNLFNEGDELWLSTTAGAMTNVKPVPPATAVFIGWCLKKAGAGKIFVRINVQRLASEIAIYDSADRFTATNVEDAIIELCDNKARISPIGGVMIKLTNKTGAPSVKGSVVSASTTTDNAFQLQSNEFDSIGIVYDNGVADGQACYVVISGVAEVLLTNGTASTRGYWVIADAVDGRANATQPVPIPGNTTAEHTLHFKEIGHCLESKVAGTNVLAKCIIHFN